MDQTILLFAHGSSDPEWAQPFQRLRQMLQSSLAGHRIELAFLESMRPGFDDAVDGIAAGGRGRITVVPLFIAQGGHLREDIPKLVSRARARHPAIDFRLLPPLGEVPEVLGAIAAWIARSQTPA